MLDTLSQAQKLATVPVKAVIPTHIHLIVEI